MTVPPKPEKEPRYLFFTGGTAFRAISQTLAEKNSNTLHIVTTFDSGGSTAELRRCFALPALGDIRNRLLALADPNRLDPAIAAFFQKRLPNHGEREKLLQDFIAYTNPSDPFWSNTNPSDVHFLTSLLLHFIHNLPTHFDLRGASFGNCILAQLFFQNGRDFDATLSFLHSFLFCRGTVIPIVHESLHLGCILEDGRSLVGQHKFKDIRSKIEEIFLTVHEPMHWTPENFDICHPPLRKEAHDAIISASAICYPMGSFYSSVVVNLLVAGVGQSLSENACPKIFIPNVGYDPELYACPIEKQCAMLLAVMQKDAPNARVCDLLNYVLIDSRYGEYMGRLTDTTLSYLRNQGIVLFDRPLCSDPVHHDPSRTIAALEYCRTHWISSNGQICL